MNDDGLSRRLTALIDRSAARAALLISTDNSWDLEIGDLAQINATALSRALELLLDAAQNVSESLSTRPRSLLLRQRDEGHLHLVAATDTVALAMLFDEYGMAGRVRHDADKIVDAIRPMLDTEAEPDNDAEKSPESTGFNELIDRIFSTR